MFVITVRDTETGEVQEMQYEHVECTRSTGFRRLDPDGVGPDQPQINETGASIALLKCWSGERVGMEKFEDFENFTDDTGGAPDTPS